MVYKVTEMKEVQLPVSRLRSISAQLIASMAPNLLLLDLGMAISFATIVIPDVLNAPTGVSLTDTQASWFGSLSFLTQPIGALASGPFVDYVGRKKATFLVNLPHVIAWILLYFAWNVPTLFIGNALLGIGTGIMEAPINSYVGEISEPSVRGALCTVTQLFLSIGISAMYFLGSVVPWRMAAIICIAIPFTSMLLVLIGAVPDTPVWLLSQGREKDALKSLCYLRGWTTPDNVREEFDKLVVYSKSLDGCVICWKEKKQETECEHYKMNLIASMAPNLLLLDLGMAISFATIVIPDVLNAPTGVSLTDTQASWFGSLSFLTQPIGALASGPFVDYVGRKKATFLVNLPHVIAWILLYFAWNVPTLFIGNALLGIGTGIMEAPINSYVGEISEPSVRGALCTVTQLFLSIGISAMYFLGSVVPWRMAAIICIAIPFTSMLLVLIGAVPDTPVWLLSQGREKDALKSLCYLRGWTTPDNVREEFDKLVVYSKSLDGCVICWKEKKQETECEHYKMNVFKRFFVKFNIVMLCKETLRPLTLSMLYFTFLVMSGLTPVKPNMVNVCSAFGMAGDSKNIVVIVGVITLIASIVVIGIIKSLGKRKLGISAMLGSAICCTALSIYAEMHLDKSVFSYDPKTFPKEKSAVPLVFFYLLTLFTGFNVSWVILGEVFPFRSRASAQGTGAAWNYVVTFIGSKTLIDLETHFRLTGAFATYAAFSYIGTIYLYFFMPETEGISLQEIESYYEGRLRTFADDWFINIFRKKK